MLRDLLLQDVRQEILRLMKKYGARFILSGSTGVFITNQNGDIIRLDDNNLFED